MNISNSNIETKHKKKTRYFELYISKLLKNTGEKHGITSNAKQQLNYSLCIITEFITNHAYKLAMISNKKTITDKEVYNAAKILLPKELATLAQEETEKTIQFFLDDHTKNQSRQTKAGLIIPPSITEKFLRNFGTSNMLVSKLAPVVLASIIEYITVDILELSMQSAKKHNKVRITIRDIYLASQTDKEINSLFNSCNIELLGGGVIPYIHPTLFKKTKSSLLRKHGDTAIKQICKYQKKFNSLTIPRNPFERLVRQHITTYNPHLKLSKDLMAPLQYYLEQYITNILKKAYDVSIYTGRIKLIDDDIKFICNLF